MSTNERTDTIHHASTDRQNCSSSYSQTSGRLFNLPYRSHPIYHLRRTLISLDVLGCICCLIDSGPYYYFPEGPVGSGALLFVSALFCFWDLVKYAKKKARNPEHDPAWPSKLVTGVDTVLAVLLQVFFWWVWTEELSYYSSDRSVWLVYGNLATMLASLLHLWCFWKQLLTLCKTQWLRKVPHGPCQRCGFSVSATAVIQDHLPLFQEGCARSHGAANMASAEVPGPTAAAATEPTLCTYAGPSADFRETSILTPQGTESAMEEGLLIGSEFSGGYGSIDNSEEQADPKAEDVEEIVVSKPKKKKGGSSEAGASQKALGKRAVK